MSTCIAVLNDQVRSLHCQRNANHDGSHRAKEWWHDTPNKARVSVTTTWGPRWEADPEATP